MPKARPYQPALLRVLHGAAALAVLGCWLSGLIVYSRYDGRWGELPVVVPGNWIDIHGSLGVVLLPLAVLLAAYAFTSGWRRLRRSTNAIPLLALALAIGTGKGMQEDWLRTGQLHHLVYQLHLLAWLILALAVAAHLVGVLRHGGWGLAQSMFSLGTRRGDRPADWLTRLRRH